MIIVEEVLRILFDQLPEMTIGSGTYKVNYSFGSHKDLLVYMNSQTKAQGGVSYPLIWLETPIERDIRRDGEITVNNMKLILATLSNVNDSNVTRLERTFKPTLIPLYENVIDILKKSGYTRILDNDDNRVTNYYNYGVDADFLKDRQSAKTTDIWDAIKLELNITMSKDCSLLAENEN